jgi:hypothetical protein
MNTKMRAGGAVVIAAIAIAGCGGGAKPKAVVDTFVSDLTKHDWKDACNQTTGPRPRGHVPNDCEHNLPRGLTPRVVEILNAEQFNNQPPQTSASGNRANVYTHDYEWHLKKLDGKWKIDDFDPIIDAISDATCESVSGGC